MEVKIKFLLQYCKTGIRKTDSLAFKKPSVFASRLWERTTEFTGSFMENCKTQSRYMTCSLKAA